MQTGDALIFRIDPESELPVGDYVTVIIPQEDLVAPERQLVRVDAAVERKVIIQPELDETLDGLTPSEIEEITVPILLMLYSEVCGCICLSSGDDFTTLRPKPIVRRRRRRRG